MNDNDYGISIITESTEESFDLSVPPSPQSKMVGYYKANLSAELDLRRLVVNLDNTAALLYISYNALSGTTAQSKVSGLQKRLSDLCAKSQVAMNQIKSNTEIVFQQLPMVYKFLITGKVEAGIKLLSTCSKYAGDMAAASEELAVAFEKMADDTQDALESSQDIYAQDIKKRDEIKAQIKEIKAQSAKLSEQSKILKEELSDIQGQYEKAVQKEEKAEKNAFIMGIVNICTSSLTLGVGEFMKNLNNKDEDGKEKTQKAEQDVEKEKADLEKAGKELEENKKALEEVTAKLKEHPEDEDLKKEAEELTKKVSESEKQKEDNTGKLAAAKAALDAVNTAVTSAKNNIDQSLAKAQDKTSKLLDQKMKMQKENRQIAGEMAELAVKLENQKDMQISADTAVEMLKLAIRCLSNIVVAFSEAALFWRSIEQGCKNLQSAGFINQIEAVKDLDAETQKEIFIEYNFKRMILVYMATWVALNTISQDYYEASVTVGKKVRENIKSNLFEKDAFLEAKRLAGQILGDMKTEEAALEENRKRLEALKNKLL